MQMDQTRIESFLDDGWSVIGQLHRWLSQTSIATDDRSSLVELIGRLQLFWANADDLGLKRLARNGLALEQVLERFCARTMELTPERLSQVTAGTECLQELLLGLEATREEPNFVDLKVVLLLESFSLGSISVDNQSVIEPVPQEASDPVVHVTTAEPNPVLNPITPIPVQQTSVDARIDLIDLTLLMMLEQFVFKLDETIHRLHVRMTTDETPYVTTTSRLQHLAQLTRELVNQIVKPTIVADSTQCIEQSNQRDSLPRFDYKSTFIKDSSELLPLEQVPSVITPTPLEQNIVEIPENISLTQGESAISEESSIPQPPETIGLILKSRHVLIVEDSMFYRHLIGVAVQSAGYEPHSTESSESGLQVLQQSPDFCAILVGSPVSPAIAELIERHRSIHGMKVISMTSSSRDGASLAIADEQVVKSHPMQLISSLNRVLNEAHAPMRKSA